MSNNKNTVSLDKESRYEYLGEDMTDEKFISDAIRDKEKLREENTALRKRCEALQTENARLNDDVKELEYEVTESRVKMKEMGRLFVEKNQRIAEMYAKIDESSMKRENIANQLENERQKNGRTRQNKKSEDEKPSGKSVRRDTFRTKQVGASRVTRKKDVSRPHAEQRNEIGNQQDSADIKQSRLFYGMKAGQHASVISTEKEECNKKTVMKLTKNAGPGDKLAKRVIFDDKKGISNSSKNVNNVLKSSNDHGDILKDTTGSRSKPLNKTDKLPHDPNYKTKVDICDNKNKGRPNIAFGVSENPSFRSGRYYRNV